jgi:hypothetical protein
VTKGTYEIHSTRGFPWNAAGTIDGSISGLTEGTKLPATARGANGLSLTLDRGHFGVPFPGARSLPLSAKGRIKISGKTLVLTRRATLPSVDVDFLVAKEPRPGSEEKWSPARLTLRTDGARRASDGTGVQFWSGNADLHIRGLNEVLDQLQDAGLLSKTLRLAADARRLDAELNWEVRPNRSIFRAESITSDGTWSASGELGRQNDGKWLGLIDAKVLGVPVGVALAPGQTEWKILPSKDDTLPGTAEKKAWINGRAVEADSKAAIRSPESAPLRKTQ